MKFDKRILSNLSASKAFNQTSKQALIRGLGMVGLKMSAWQLFLLKLIFDILWYVVYVPFVKKQKVKEKGRQIVTKKKQAIKEIRDAKEPIDLRRAHAKLLKL